MEELVVQSPPRWKSNFFFYLGLAVLLGLTAYPETRLAAAYAYLLATLVSIHLSGFVLTGSLAGIPIDKITLGFGPDVAAYRFRNTEVSVGAIPLGGYVK